MRQRLDTTDTKKKNLSDLYTTNNSRLETCYFFLKNVFTINGRELLLLTKSLPNFIFNNRHVVMGSSIKALLAQCTPKVAP